MNESTADAYRARLRRVLELIDRHLDEDLSVDRLSRVACFSKFHFHRQFSEMFQMGVHEYVQLRRLKRASWRLAFRANASVLEIALDSGYESPEAFARAFKRRFGTTPTAFRQQPPWSSWSSTLHPLGEMRRQFMKPEHSVDAVAVVTFQETAVAALEHRGDPALLGESIRRFIEWRKAHGPSRRVSATFNIAYDGRAVEPEAFRFDICASLANGELAVNAHGIVRKTIPGGRCAVLRHNGSDETLGESVRFLYTEWLPASGEELRDFPLFFQRVSFFPDVSEHEAVTDIFLPLR